MKVAELERSIEEKTQEKFNTGIKRNVLEERKRQIEKELKSKFEVFFVKKPENEKIEVEIDQKKKKRKSQRHFCEHALQCFRNQEQITKSQKAGATLR